MEQLVQVELSCVGSERRWERLTAALSEVAADTPTLKQEKVLECEKEILQRIISRLNLTHPS